MKRLTIFLTLLLLCILAAPVAATAGTTWEIDKNHSGFYFTIDHIFSKVRGHFDDYSGRVVFDPNDLAASQFSFVIKTGSINTHIAKRDKHLASPDFFDAATFPTMEFTSRAITKTGENSYAVAGTFLVKGKSYDLVLPLTLAGIKDHPMEKGKRVVGFNGQLTIDRLAFGVGSGKFYELGVVGKEVDILVTMELLAEK